MSKYSKRGKKRKAPTSRSISWRNAIITNSIELLNVEASKQTQRLLVLGTQSPRPAEQSRWLLQSPYNTETVCVIGLRDIYLLQLISSHLPDRISVQVILSHSQPTGVRRDLKHWRYLPRNMPRAIDHRYLNLFSSWHINGMKDRQESPVLRLETVSSVVCVPWSCLLNHEWCFSV